MAKYFCIKDHMNSFIPELFTDVNRSQPLFLIHISGEYYSEAGSTTLMHTMRLWGERCHWRLLRTPEWLLSSDHSKSRCVNVESNHHQFDLPRTTLELSFFVSLLLKNVIHLIQCYDPAGKAWPSLIEK